MADQLISGTRFRALTVLDVFTKECLAIEPGQSLKGEHVVPVLKRIGAQRGTPKSIFCDNGSEIVGKRTPKEFAAVAGTCAGCSSDEMPETRNQSGTQLG